MKRQDLAARSRISVWAAVQEQERRSKDSNGIPTISSRNVGRKRCQKECANGGLIFNAETKKMTVDTEHCVG